MAIPEPRFKSSAQFSQVNGVEVLPLGAVQIRKRERAVEQIQFERGAFIDCPDATGAALVAMDSFVSQAGLAGGWLALKAQARIVNKSVPGHLPVTATTPWRIERFNFGTTLPQQIRAWAYAYAPALLDLAAEQSPAAAGPGWDWW